MQFLPDFFFSYEILNSIPRGQGFDLLMTTASRFGEEWFFTLILPLMIAFGRFRLATITGLAFFSSVFVNQILKLLGGLPRPDVTQLTLEAQDLFLKYPELSNGLPSGHSQIAMSFFLLAAVILRRGFFFWAALALAVLIPFSRLYIGVHFFGDVLVGSMIGGIIAWLAYRKGLDLIDFNAQKSSTIYVFYTAILLCLCFIFDVKLVWVTGGSLLGFLMGINKLHKRFDISTLHTIASPTYSWLFILVGLISLLALRTILKLIFPAWHTADFLRYFIMLYLVSYTLPVLLHRFLNYQISPE